MLHPQQTTHNIRSNLPKQPWQLKIGPSVHIQIQHLNAHPIRGVVTMSFCKNSEFHEQSVEGPTAMEIVLSEKSKNAVNKSKINRDGSQKHRGKNMSEVSQTLTGACTSTPKLAPLDSPLLWC